MVNRGPAGLVALGAVLPFTAVAHAQQVGSLRGLVVDGDFDLPVPAARVTILELQRTVETDGQGLYTFGEVPAGQYTVVFAKQGYARVVRTGIVVNAGQLTDVDVELSGDFEEMEEVVVQDVVVGTPGQALLDLRLDSPALVDAISSDLLSRAGASDAAAALNLVAGASVQDGKFAVIRGLPDRYVVSKINGVRLPTADETKRAVELDQFPSAVIDNIQVTKTFTPDQQGDASGGAVDVILKGIPDEPGVRLSGQMSYNSQTSERSDFLTYEGGGVGLFGDDDGDRDPGELGEQWDGALGVERGEAPVDFKWGVSAGGTHEFDGGLTVGAFGTFFYERDSSYVEDAIDDSYWVTTPGEGLVPETNQGVPDPGGGGDFRTALFDVDRGSQSVQWGGLGVLGLEIDNHRLNLAYLFTRTAEDEAILAEDTRGKAYFFEDYDPDDPAGEGNSPDNIDAAPYIRTQTLEYTERTVESMILNGSHELPIDDFGDEEYWIFRAPVVDWSVARSRATFYQPDKRQFGSVWRPASLNPGLPPFIPPFVQDPIYSGYKPAAVFSLGNIQRIYKEIEEESDQRQLDLTLPFEQWTGTEGYFKVGVFSDDLERTYDQDTFSNFGDNTTVSGVDFETFFSELVDPTFSDGPPFVDVDYRGEQEIFAWYLMGDLPLTEWLSVIGGVRWEETRLSVRNDPEEDATWFPEGALTPISLQGSEADVDFNQDDLLPAIALLATPLDDLTLRASYSETIARQTFREITPIQQQEFLGGDVFIGNPDLRTASLKNYDLRGDWTPLPGGLFSVSYFYKDVEDAIETVQRVVGYTFTTARNYPEGTLEGWEFEARQDLGEVWEPLRGLTLGANATLIDSEVTLPDDEAELFLLPTIQAPLFTRDATNAPEYLYNLYFTYDIEPTGTQLSLFYTHRGDTLIAGATQSDGNFIPSVYETDYGTLNFTLTQDIGRYVKIRFQAKNLTNPEFQTVYRSQYIEGDVVKTSFTRGIDYSIGISASIPF